MVQTDIKKPRNFFSTCSQMQREHLEKVFLKLQNCPILYRNVLRVKQIILHVKWGWSRCYASIQSHPVWLHLCLGIWKKNERVCEGNAQNLGFVTYKGKDFQLTKQLWLKHSNTTLRSETLQTTQRHSHPMQGGRFCGFVDPELRGWQKDRSV